MNPETNWKEELQSAYLYKKLSRREKNLTRSQLFAQLAEEAEAQAKIWIDPLPRYQPDFRTRVVGLLIDTFNPRWILPILVAHKIRGVSTYKYSIEEHATPKSPTEIGKRHRSFQSGNNLRAAVFGVNDGLVSNTLLILGVAGASSNSEGVLLAGSAGLLAGALSMAAGEFISVQSQKEMFEYQIGLEKAELEKYPQQEAAELALIYEAKGMSKDEAKRLSQQIISDPEKALDTLAREELGLNPDDLGSPPKAAAYSFVSFALGAFVPLTGFLFFKSDISLPLSLCFSGFSLFATGAVTSLFTGRNAIFGGLRMFLIGGAAGLLTYWIGEWIGASL